MGCVFLLATTRMQNAQPKWILARRLAELIGYTEDAIKIKAKRGFWPRGIYWRLAPDGNRVYNLEAIQAWMSGEELGEAVWPDSNGNGARGAPNGARVANCGTRASDPLDGEHLKYL